MHDQIETIMEPIPDLQAAAETAAEAYDADPSPGNKSDVCQSIRDLIAALLQAASDLRGAGNLITCAIPPLTVPPPSGGGGS